MRKYIIAILLMLVSIPWIVNAQQKTPMVTEKGNYTISDSINVDSRNIIFSTNSQKSTYKAGEYFQKSSAFQLASITSAGIGGIIAVIGGTIKDNGDDDRKKDVRTACFAGGAILGAASIVCAIISIDYKLKAGRHLKLGVIQSGGVIRYTF